VHVVLVGKQRHVYLAFGLIVLSLSAIFFGYLGYREEQELAGSGGPSNPPPGEVCIIIDTPKKTLLLLSDGVPYKQYKVAVGKSETPTPIGEWRVVWKDQNWGTGFGSRWMGLNVPWGTFGIHGTNKPWSVGRFASHGCIRMHNKSIEELFEWIPIGTMVKISGPPVRVKRNLKIKMSGQDVVMVQQRLRDLGIYGDRADGIYGPSMMGSVKQFQENNGLSPTGIVDRETRKALGFLE